MNELPPPPVPADTDLKDFPFTPIFRARLFGSTFHATASDGGWRAGVTLWLKSWDQVPAGSLPADEVSLCRLAELGRDLRAWRKLSVEALHGWQEHADGRLYHNVVTEGVNDAWQRKMSQRDRTAKARAARMLQRSHEEHKSSATTSVTDYVTEIVTVSKGQGQGQKKEEDSGSSLRSEPAAGGAADPVKQIFDRGVRLYVGAGAKDAKAREILGKQRREFGDAAVLAALASAESEMVSDPVPYVAACLNRSKSRAPIRHAGGVVPMHPGAGG